MYRSMCVSFLCIHFYLHPERVKDGQFSNAFAYMYSYFLLKIFTRFDTFRADNTREIQHESRRKAGGNLHLRSAVVDLRVQLVGTFTFFFLYTRKALHIALFLSLSLSVYRAMEFQSGAALYSLWNGIQIISTMLFTLYFMRRIIRAHFN
jgi:hypothetical protein